MALDLRPASGDSVIGTGTVRVAGRPRTVVLRGRWNEIGDGRRSLDATLQADTTPNEHWSLAWSPSDLEGSLQWTADADSRASVALSAQ